MAEGAADNGARAAEEAVEAVVRGMGLEADVRVEPGDGETDLQVVVDGAGTSALVGRGGETIDALQYLVAQIASRAAGGERRRVALDADGYRAAAGRRAGGARRQGRARGRGARRGDRARRR